MKLFRPRPTARARELRNQATVAERKLWQHLRASRLGHKFSRQMPVGPFIADFMCREKRLVIELDGGQHCDSASDILRTRFIECQGYRIIRFWNNEIFENLEGVVIQIADTLLLPPPPAPPASGRGEMP